MTVFNEDLNRLIDVQFPYAQLSGKVILVTGASGQLGRYLCSILAEKAEQFGFNVVAMSRSGERLLEVFGRYTGIDHFTIYPHDVNEQLDDRYYDIIIHCASNTHPSLYSNDPVGTILTNTMGLNNLINRVKKGGRLVYLSSVEVYGENRGDTDKFDEGYCGYIDCNTVRAGYNESKRLGESLCQAYGKQRGLDFVIVRLSRTYGPSLDPEDTKAISQFIFAAVKGEDIVLRSQGDQLYSYCYSSDAVDAILYLLFYGKTGEAYNVAGLNSDHTLNEVARMISEATGVNIVHKEPDKDEFFGYSTATKAVLDISKIRKLGWEPRVTMREGLERTVNHLRSSDLSL